MYRVRSRVSALDSKSDGLRSSILRYPVREEYEVESKMIEYAYKLILFIYATIVYVIPLLAAFFLVVVMPMIGIYYIISSLG